MANHKSALKRIRQTEKRRLRNRYALKTARHAVRRLRGESDAKAAAEALPKVCGMIDKLVRNRIVHKNKGANLKSKLALHVKALDA